MSGTGNKRKGTNMRAKTQPDGKRLKAKVGKRMPKSANETDTSFRKASLHIAGQTVYTQSADAVISNRGRSLAELSQLSNHPAGKARLSAIKGLLNIVTENNGPRLRPHLHILLQAACKALVDEENHVRMTGHALLEHILAQQQRETFVPFISLLVAYTGSSLDSLDPKMRLDGVKAVVILATFFQSLLQEYVPALLPPFVNLLAEKDRSRNLHCILEGLTTLLNTLPLKEDPFGFALLNKNAQQQTQFQCLPMGRSRNVFVQRTPRFSNPVLKLGGVDDMFKISQTRSTARTAKSSLRLPANTVVSKESFGALNEMRTKLEDVLAELLEEENNEATDPRKRETSMQTTKALLHAIHLVWEPQIASFFEGDELKPVHGVGTRTAKMLMELFPLTGGCMGLVAPSDVDAANSFITRTLLILVPFQGEESNAWIDKLFLYLVDAKPAGRSEQSLSAAHVDIMNELLQAVTRQEKYAELRNKMYQELHRHFFKCQDPSLSRSPAGRKAASILSYELLRSEELVLNISMMSSFQRFPSVLGAWSADFESESCIALDALRHLATIQLGDDDSSDKIRGQLRAEISRLFQPQTNEPSVFESYSLTLQRKVLGLVRVLGSPSKSALKAMAAICSLPQHSMIGNEIFVTVSSLRKSIRMPDYLAFVIGSIGATRCTQLVQGGWEDMLGPLDQRISRGSKAVIECGSIRCIVMLMPQLLHWTTTDDNVEPTLGSVLRARIGAGILLMLLSDIRRIGFQLNSSPEFSMGVKECEKAIGHTEAFISGKTILEKALEDKLLAPSAVLADFTDKMSTS